MYISYGDEKAEQCKNTSDFYGYMCMPVDMPDPGVIARIAHTPLHMRSALANG
jgi:hypothetical protein